MAFTFPWTNRVDNVDYVMANDVNVLAAGIREVGDYVDTKTSDISATGVAVASANLESNNVADALEELFQFVSDGKTALVADIETMGGTVEQTGAAPTFSELGAGILSIPSGGGGLSQMIRAGVSAAVDDPSWALEALELGVSVNVGATVTTDVRVI